MEQNDTNLIAFAKKIANNPFFDTDWYRYIYPFTTENISGYIDNFDLKNKSLLTVGSSSDQVINAIYKGSSDITLYDLNLFAEYYYYLKAASILCLDIDEFMNFLSFPNFGFATRENCDTFSPSIFNKIKNELKNLDNEAFTFWDTLFSETDSLYLRDRLFLKDEYSPQIVRKINCYLNSEDEYLATRKKLQNVKPNFIVGDVKNMDLNKKFNNIWLSNIGTLMPLENDLKNMIDVASKHLDKHGRLLICYLYKADASTPYSENEYPVYKVTKFLKYLRDYKPELISHIGIDQLKCEERCGRLDFGLPDSILLYKKKR